MRHAEVLEHGELGVRPLRTAKATDSYVLAGRRRGRLELDAHLPRLPLRRDRRASATSATEDVEAIVVGSRPARAPAGSTRSHALLNRFHENVVWGMRGNFVDVPTDCPQRDERLGWTGDIQVFSPTASFLFDTRRLPDLLAGRPRRRAAEGRLGAVRRPGRARDTRPGHGRLGRRGDDRAVGDLRAHRRRRSARAPAAEHARLGGPDGRAGRRRPALGRRLPVRRLARPDRAAGRTRSAAKADPDVVATAHLARSAEIVAAGRRGRSATPTSPASTPTSPREVRRRVRRASTSPRAAACSSDAADRLRAGARSGRCCRRRASAQRAGERLADLVRTAGFRISTGFVGTPLIADALTDAGQPDLAYRLLLQTGCPSWLYSVTMGATTVWERWDSMLPDGSINPGEMTSFNHYALGAVADWMHRRVAGPRARRRPATARSSCGRCPTARLTAASARHLHAVRRGRGRPGTRSDGELRLSVTSCRSAPRARSHVPGESEPVEVGHGTHEWTRDPYARDAGAARGADGPAAHRPRGQLGRRSSPPPSRPASSPTRRAGRPARSGTSTRRRASWSTRSAGATSPRLPKPCRRNSTPCSTTDPVHRSPHRCRCPEGTSPWRSQMTFRPGR